MKRHQEPSEPERAAPAGWTWLHPLGCRAALLPFQLLHRSERLDAARGVELYAEVLLKIDTYHCERAGLEAARLPRRRDLDIALTEPAFMNRFPRPVSLGKRRMYTRAVQSREYQCDENSHAAAVPWPSSDIAASRLGVSHQAAILEFTVLPLRHWISIRFI